MAIDQNAQKSFLDALYCEEEKWGDVLEHEDYEINDFLWEDEELESLFTKERESWCCLINSCENGAARKEAVEWILKINGHYGFSALTCVLAVNYLDRFLFTKEKPWMMQLVAVTCLSLAAKVEETYVPLLLDLQVQGTKFVFEAKTIQKMELLVLSGLKWRMNPVTPLSFLDHIVTTRFRFGLKSCIRSEMKFLTSCHNLLLSLISDPRFRLYPPSVLATSTMLHVIHQYETCNAIHYEAQLLSLLKINKEKVGECYEMIAEVLVSNNNNSLKRKFCEGDESWSDEESSCISSESSPPFFKKTTSVEQDRIRLQSLTTVFVDAGSPH